MSRRLLALFLTALVAGCGFKGDLYLPKTPAPAHQTAHPATQAPAQPAAAPDNRTAP
ncbi:MAG: lipoprotein [Laribacter sp.]|nr:lipoprotein [Laribacter sp.]MBP9527017.1 lipoprotein [Laribacter sp.]MBP9608624.1 lipoprotein [Laribacter sp.]